MDAEDPNLCECLIGLKLHCDEPAADLGAFQRRLSTGEPDLTAKRFGFFSDYMRLKPKNGDGQMRQAHARLLVREVSVTKKEIHISGSNAIMAKATPINLGSSAPAVLSSVRDWLGNLDSQQNWPRAEIPEIRGFPKGPM